MHIVHPCRWKPMQIVHPCRSLMPLENPPKQKVYMHSITLCRIWTCADYDPWQSETLCNVKPCVVWLCAEGDHLCLVWDPVQSWDSTQYHTALFIAASEGTRTCLHIEIFSHKVNLSRKYFDVENVMFTKLCYRVSQNKLCIAFSSLFWFLLYKIGSMRKKIFNVLRRACPHPNFAYKTFPED